MKTPWWFLRITPLSFILWPVGWLYYLIGRMVYVFRAIKPLKSRRKIICVGNILAGGVGKTPVVRQIATRLDSPVVMRGYKKSKDFGNGSRGSSLKIRILLFFLSFIAGL